MAQVMRKRECKCKDRARCAHKPWVCRYQAAGKQKEESFKTKGLAAARAVEVERTKLEGAPVIAVKAGRMDFASYAQAWIAGLDRRPGTRNAYAAALNGHLAPAVAGRTLAQVAADREAMAGLLAGLREAEQGSVAGLVLTVLRGALNEAVAAGRISGHRMAGLSVRRRRTPKAVEIIPVTTSQLEALATGLKEFGVLVWVMAGTGARISEALAGRLQDFRDNGHGKVLRLHQQVGRDGSLAPLKHRAEGEYRDVPVPEWCWQRVQEHVERYGCPDGFLLRARAGGRVKYGSYKARFTTQAERAGLPGYDPHQLRHRFASTLLSAGVPITDVATWLGHSDVSVTFATYSHLLPDAWERGRAALEALAA